MKDKIRLIALDLDGTLLTDNKKITQKNIDTLRRAQEKDVFVVAATGRPYVGLPMDVLEAVGITYAITANGAAVYQVPQRKCLFSDGIAPQQAQQIVSELIALGVHTDIYVDGQGYGQQSSYDKIDSLDIHDAMKEYLRKTRIYMEDLPAFLGGQQKLIQKITTNYYRNSDGTYRAYAKVREMYEGREDLSIVSGGKGNLEITKRGISKGTALQILADFLEVPMAQTMACGDSENDLDILKTAAVGVAMGNSAPYIREAADFVTLTNGEDGVAYAVEKLVLASF